MDKKKSILNVTVSIGGKVFAMILSIVVKRFLIRCCGNEVNGLNSLYLSIIGFMTVAELGVGSAITFSMYKPIVENDTEKVSALYGLYRRLYLIIGSVILVAGLMVSPFIHILAKDYEQLDVNFTRTFILMLISTVLTYMYGAKTALFNAYKNNYVTTAITQCGIIFRYILQIIVLITIGTFEAYLVCRIIDSLCQWTVTEIITRKQYQSVVSLKRSVDLETSREVMRNVKAMFMHKVGFVLVNTLDSVIIAAFVGVVVLGEYSNYTTIVVSLSGVLKLVFTSLTSVLGHMCVQENQKVARDYCETFHFLNFAIGAVFFLGYYAIIDNLIAMFFAADLIIEKSISFVITVNGFVQFMRESTLVFRDATGTFYNDRWKPFAEGVVNVVFSVLFVKQFGVVGVIVATIGTNLLICHIVEPYVLYKFAFGESPKRYYVRNYLCILIFVVSLCFLDRCMFNLEKLWLELLVNGSLSVCIAVAICIMMLSFNPKVLRRFIRKKGE